MAEPDLFLPAPNRANVAERACGTAFGMGEASLRPAAARRHIIKRPRLTRLLDETPAPVILLTAPAGYGKTTLAREWLADKPHAWHQATAASADPVMLARGLAAALDEFLPGVGKRVAGRIAAVDIRPPNAEDLAALLTDGLAPSRSPRWLAIDDYHRLLKSRESQRLIELLGSTVDLKLLITSRSRPNWVTARRILYGEILEIGSSALAVTHEEASAILGGRPTPDVAGLVALARGWPAVIGLAAHSGRAPAHGDVPERLYEFFAEELYVSASEPLKEALPFFALLPSMGLDTLRTLVGDHVLSLLDEAIANGIFAGRDDGIYEVHPLLGAFLLRRIAEEYPDRLEHAVARALHYFVDKRAWDEAFSLFDLRPSLDRSETLLGAAWEDLLAQGRYETLERWLSIARRHGESPVLHLISAEVAFRRGEYERAKISALTAINGLPLQDASTPRAWLRAGYAAEFLDDYHSALTYFDEARASAVTHHDLTEAMRGRASAAIAAGHPAARDWWRDYESLESLTHEDALRRATGRMVAAAYFGEIDQALAETAGTESLFEDIADPMARTSFLHNRAYNYVLAARYADARDSLRLQIRQHREYGLYFAIPHALVNLARAEFGLRNFRGTRAAASEALDRLVDQADVHVAMNAQIVSTRLAMAAGSGLDRLEGELERFPRSATLGEAYAIRSLMHACAGDAASARADAATCDDMPQSAETLALRSWLEAVLAIHAGRPAVNALERALALMETTGIRDALVAAYRGCPDLLSALLESFPDRSQSLALILREAHDSKLAHRLGLLSGTPIAHLSARELEVLALLSQGLSNAAIAARLVIAPSTVKAHIRHIFEKLGVRSRTAAANCYLQA